jgi:hypothetical protein
LRTVPAAHQLSPHRAQSAPSHHAPTMNAEMQPPRKIAKNARKTNPASPPPPVLPTPRRLCPHRVRAIIVMENVLPDPVTLGLPLLAVEHEHGRQARFQGGCGTENYLRPRSFPVEGAEYYIRAGTASGGELVWPATAPAMNQTLVRMN